MGVHHLCKNQTLKGLNSTLTVPAVTIFYHHVVNKVLSVWAMKGPFRHFTVS